MMPLLDTNFDQWQAAPAEFAGAFPEIGQLITPLTGFRDYGAKYGIDNGAYAGFNAKRFMAIIRRQLPRRDRCLFVAVPDAPFSAQRTLEVFNHWRPELAGWPLAFVAQNGVDGSQIPWSQIKCLFIGGDDEMKDGREGASCARAAMAMGKWVHWGRLNGVERMIRVMNVMRDYPDWSFDGSGLSKHTHMRVKLGRAVLDPPADDEPKLFQAEGEAA
jgi:hypothetical protein